jgi:hypothetical protein
VGSSPAGQFHIQLADVVLLARPVSSRSQRGLWFPDRETWSALREQLPAASHPGGGTLREPGRRVQVGGDLFHGRVPEGAMYIGRGAPGLTASPYANLYPVRVHGLEASLRLCREHLGAHPALVVAIASAGRAVTAHAGARPTARG